jgi:arsenite-transporting ATPase
VGKTTCAAGAAVAAAERGHRVLLVSTDPAHSLGDALQRPLSARPRRVPTRRGALEAMELDADRALDRWIAARRRLLRTILERGTYLDEDDIDRFLRLSFPGVDELIGLVELARLARARPWDDVVVDTAPTGHTLRLLVMPATLERIAAVLDDMQAKHRFLAQSLGGAHRPDATDALIDEIATEGRSLQALLNDPDRCTFAWVLLPEPLALEEAKDGIGALDRAGISVSEIIVNRVVPPPDRACELCDGRRRAEQAAIAAARAAFPRRPLRLLPDLADEPRGVAALRRVARHLAAPPSQLGGGLRPSSPSEGATPQARPQGATAPSETSPQKPIARAKPALETSAGTAWLERIAPPGLRLLLFAGKGGVGKTTCAAAAALALAARAPRADILLLSTDPAHSLADVLAIPVGDDPHSVPGAPRLRARELDADRAFAAKRARYREAVDDLFAALRGGSRFEVAFDRAVVQDLIDLAPPGLDELFGILTVIEALFPEPGAGRRYDTVVLDTAPTGHALRLLELPDAALEWVHALLEILLKYRKVIGLGELGMDLVTVSRDLKRLGALLRDRAETGLVAVTRPAELPRLETHRLLQRIGRLRIPLAALLVNAVTPPGCARCRTLSRREARQLAALRRECRSPARGRCGIIVAPAVAPPPRGAEALARWRARWELDRETR